MVVIWNIFGIDTAVSKHAFPINGIDFDECCHWDSEVTLLMEKGRADSFGMETPQDAIFFPVICCLASYFQEI